MNSGRTAGGGVQWKRHRRSQTTLRQTFLCPRIYIYIFTDIRCFNAATYQVSLRSTSYARVNCKVLKKNFFFSLSMDNLHVDLWLHIL